MNLTYQLPFEMREKLEEEALRLKVEPDALVLRLLQDFLLTDSSDGTKKNVPQKSDADRFQRWADGHSRKTPVLSLSAMSREKIYEDRGYGRS